MIDINVEKNLRFNTADMYAIVQFAIQEAEEMGFMNSYVFERALYVYAADVFYAAEGIQDEVIKLLTTQGVLSAWQYLLAEGIIDKLVAEYKPEMDYLAAIGETWFADYAEYCTSIRAALTSFQLFGKEFTKETQEQVEQLTSEEELSDIYKIANEWGLSKK